MKNIDVIKGFINKELCNTTNLRSDGTRLWSYNTVIAEFLNIDGECKLVINKTKYSATTSRHQNMLVHVIDNKYNIIETTKRVSMHTQHLADFI